MTKPAKSDKPVWPHADIVRLSAHPNGQWCKKVKGRLHYFGPWGDPEGALQRYLNNAKGLHRGGTVRTSPSSTPTVADVFNAYLVAREPDVRQSRRDEWSEDSIGAEAFTRYRRAGQMAAEVLGAGTPADELTPADFARLRDHLKAKYKPQSMHNYLNCTKTAFRWAYEDGGLLERSPRFGEGFKVKGRKRSIRESKSEGRKKLLSSERIRDIVNDAEPWFKACVLLGINCGFGSADCSDLTDSDIDLDRRVVELRRYKTAVHRVCPLWQATADAIREARELRPAPDNKADADRVLLTPKGLPLVALSKATRDDEGRIKAATHWDSVFATFTRTYRRNNWDRPRGCGFSWLRHTFYTVARRTKDYDGVDVIQGHASEGMIEHYLEDVELVALRDIVNHVAEWLNLDAAEGDGVIARIG